MKKIKPVKCWVCVDSLGWVFFGGMSRFRSLAIHHLRSELKDHKGISVMPAEIRVIQKRKK